MSMAADRCIEETVMTVKVSAATALGILLLSQVALLPPTAHAAEPYEIQVILPLTGTGAFLGQGQQQGLQLAEHLVNQEGGIDGRPVHFVVHDDQTSPQVAVQLAADQAARHSAILLGPSVSATCRAVLPLMRDGPVDYCYSPTINPEPGSYVFSASIQQEGLVETVVRYFHARGWKKIALIASTDATGQEGEKGADRAVALPGLEGMSIVERVHYNPTDVSVAAQIERVRAAQPQAVIAWTTGTPVGTVLKGLAQAGYEVPIAVGSGNVIYSFMRQYAAVLPKELYFSIDQGTARGDGLKLDPSVAAAKQRYVDAFQAIGMWPDTGTGTMWDATMIVVDALRHLGANATAAQLRDHIAHLKAYAGVYGIYDFEKLPQRGIGQKDAVVVRWNAGKAMFEAVSQPGGDQVIAP
jgi:branched-chain amino acid transport system substrate-binding protein